MTISKREAQKYLWDFMSHLWEFLTKRKQSFMTRIIFVSFMDIYDQKETVIHDKNYFCLIHEHL